MVGPVVRGRRLPAACLHANRDLYIRALVDLYGQDPNNQLSYFQVAGELRGGNLGYHKF